MSNVKSTKTTEKQAPNVRKAFKLNFFNSKKVFILFFCSTVLFTLLSLFMLYAQSATFIKQFDYADCRSRYSSMEGRGPKYYKLYRADFPANSPANSSTNSSSSNSSHHSSPRDSSIHTCMGTFDLEEDWHEVLYVHYQMNDYYKNFMSFSNSYSDKQVFGDFDSKVLRQCSSQTNHEDLLQFENSTCAIAPCGELPNFMFNDTVRIYYHLNATTKIPIEISSRHLTDNYFDLNFNNPNRKALPLVQRHTKKPRNWQKGLFELDPEDGANNGFRHQRLIVWMYPNPFSTFSKLYGRITANFDTQIADYFNRSAKTNRPSDKPFSDEKSPYLRKGNYSLEVTYNYPLWSGKPFKRFTISSVGLFGQKNQMFITFICLATVVSFLSTILVYLIYRFHDNKYRLYISRLSNADVQF